MSFPYPDQAYAITCEKTQEIYYDYQQILGSNPMFYERWQSINGILHELSKVINPVTSEPEKLASVVELVQSLRDDLAMAASQQSVPHPDPDHEFQVLTDADRATAEQHRAILKSIQPINGKVSLHAETGTEGAWWTIEKTGFTGYEALAYIEEGSRLVIFNPDGSVLFDDIIIYDTKSGWVPFRKEMPFGTGQQCCGPFRSHWIQKGKTSEEWEKIYLGALGYQAELYKLPKSFA